MATVPDAERCVMRGGVFSVVDRFLLEIFLRCLVLHYFVGLQKT
jgi:hypothetical protein